jgi:hypothetical protein
MGTLYKRNTPEKVTPVGNPVVYSMEYTTPSDAGFYWLSEIWIDGSKRTSVKKQAVYNNDIYFDFSKLLNDLVTYDFQPTVTGFASTSNSIKPYIIKDGYYSTADGDTVNNRSTSYVLNAAIDRDKFLDYSEEKYQMLRSSPYTGTSPDAGEFLTYITERSVDINDYGTLSFFNGSNYSAPLTIEGVKFNVTYKDGSTRQYFLDNDFVGSSDVTEMRPDIGVYPANINDYSNDTYLKWNNEIILTSVITEALSGNILVTVTGDIDDIINSVGETITIEAPIVGHNYSGSYIILDVVSLNETTVQIEANTLYISPSSGAVSVQVRKHIGDTITSDVKYYDVATYYLEQYVSPQYRFNVKSNCTDKWRVSYLNPLGAFETISLDGVGESTINTEWESYAKKLGTLDTYNWSYTNQDFEEVKFAKTAQESFRLRTGYLNKTESEMIVELIQSPTVFLTKDNTTWLPINITTDSARIVTTKDKLVNWEIEAQLAYKNRRQ